MSRPPPHAEAPEHGGDLDWARARFPGFAGKWLDLSTGVSPYPWPAPPVAAAALRRLPSAADLDALRAAAAAAYGGEGPEQVAAAPGAQAALPQRARRRLVIDESFADAVPEACLRPLPAGVVVLRSFGKFYGLPGLRLGFALAAPETAARLRRALGPWPVSGPALAAGTAALADLAWRKAARARLREAAQRLDGILAALGCAPAGGTPLFRLVRAPGGLFERLGGRGIYVRRFADRPALLRFGLPGTDEARLAACAGGAP